MLTELFTLNCNGFSRPHLSLASPSRWALRGRLSTLTLPNFDKPISQLIFDHCLPLPLDLALYEL